MTRIEYLDDKVRLSRLWLFCALEEYQLISRQRGLTHGNRHVSLSEDSLPVLVTYDDKNSSESEDSLPALVSSSEDSLPALVTDDDENSSESED